MSRKLRRALARAKPSKPVKPLRQPKLLMQYNDFEQIDKFFRGLEAGEVNELRGQIVMQTYDKVVYEVVPAITAWMDYWMKVSTTKGIELDDSPMRSLIAKLNAGMPITHGQIAKAKDVVDRQRAMFMAVPWQDISSIAKTEQIKMFLPDIATNTASQATI